MLNMHCCYNEYIKICIDVIMNILKSPKLAHLNDSSICKI